VSLTPRNQTGYIGGADPAHDFLSNYSPAMQPIREDVALMWTFDTDALLAINPNASTIKAIEVMCATFDASQSPPVLSVNMTTGRASLTAFLLKGVPLA
jgi:hypothetical protein